MLVTQCGVCGPDLSCTPGTTGHSPESLSCPRTSGAPPCRTSSYVSEPRGPRVQPPPDAGGWCNDAPCKGGLPPGPRGPGRKPLGVRSRLDHHGRPDGSWRTRPLEHGPAKASMDPGRVDPAAPVQPGLRCARVGRWRTASLASPERAQDLGLLVLALAQHDLPDLGQLAELGHVQILDRGPGRHALQLPLSHHGPFRRVG